MPIDQLEVRIGTRLLAAGDVDSVTISSRGGPSPLKRQRTTTADNTSTIVVAETSGVRIGDSVTVGYPKKTNLYSGRIQALAPLHGGGSATRLEIKLRDYSPFLAKPSYPPLNLPPPTQVEVRGNIQSAGGEKSPSRLEVLYIYTKVDLQDIWAGRHVAFLASGRPPSIYRGHIDEVDITITHRPADELRLVLVAD